MTKITISQLFTIILLGTGLSNHVIVTPILIDASGRDAWISVIIGYVSSLVFSLLLLYVTRQFQSVSLFEWLSFTYSQLLSRIIAIFIVVYLLITGWITLKETVMWTEETFLFNTPTIFIALFLLACSLYISYEKLSVIAICAGVLLPFVLMFGIFVAIGTIPDKNYHLVTPILVENGWQEVLHGAFIVFSSIIEIFLIIILQHQVTQKLKFKHFIVLITFLAILTVGPLLGTIAIFGVEEASKLRYPSFFQWRILGIGTYFNHLDFLSIYQWTSGNFIHLAIILYLITEVFDIKKKKQRVKTQVFICIIYLLVIIAPISNEDYLIFLSRYYYIISSVIGVFITLLIALLIKFSKNRRSPRVE